MRRGTFSWGETPDELIKQACNEDCPDGYPMLIKHQDEWTALAACVNKGIDAHLEAITERSKFDATTGEVNVHPDELHVLLRRLKELDADGLFPDWDYEVENNPAESLRSDILSTLDIEEV